MLMSINQIHFYDINFTSIRILIDFFSLYRRFHLKFNMISLAYRGNSVLSCLCTQSNILSKKILYTFFLSLLLPMLLSSQQAKYILNLL